MKTLTIWLLSGALAASLQWNLRVLGTTEHAKEIDPPALGLSAEQARALDGLCRSECAKVDELEGRAEAKLAELRRSLAAPKVDEQELRALAGDVSELRARALTACVESIVQVRAILDAGQVEKLLESCCRVEACDASACGR